MSANDGWDGGTGSRRRGSMSRRDLLKALGVAGGGTLLYQAPIGLGATTSLAAQTPEATTEARCDGQHVVILGAGVAGLAAAYELRKRGCRCTVVEAQSWIGGRSLTLRPDDELVENPLRPYRDTRAPESRQRCMFRPSNATGFDRPYLNAGPGRLPSAHVHVLALCKELGVPLEVYVMESRSNLVRNRAQSRIDSRVNRHIANDARGRIAEALFALAPNVPGLDRTQRTALQELLIQFGYLGDGKTGERGVYAKGGKYQRPEPRAGYKVLPEVAEGVDVDPLSLTDVLATEFWKTRFYQPEDFLWQPTLFQPVGGMDRIEKALAEKIGEATIRKSSPVKAIRYDRGARKWRIEVERGPAIDPADACLSNIPLPLLRGPLGDLGAQPFPEAFKLALGRIFGLPATGIDGFLAPTCKVGWQAPRALWQEPDRAANRVVPIYGGISWTSHPLTQIWYPSDRYFDELGVLTGAYNFGTDAVTWGEYSPGWRLDNARAGAGELAGPAFAAGLDAGLSIAWQNIEHIRGGWAQWQNVHPDRRVRTQIYNTLAAGDPESRFFVVGDQLSQLPGWKEGAVVSARHAVNMLTVPGFEAPEVESVPDSRSLVEGMVPLEIEE